MKEVIIDVMLMGGVKFYCQLTYHYNPLFKVDPEELMRYAVEKLPSLKDKKDVVLVWDKNNKRVKI